MIARKIVFIVCGLSVVLLADSPAPATEPFTPVGTVIGTILKFPRGTRSISMGTTGCADPSEPMNSYFNPANAFLLEEVWLTGGYNEWPSDIQFRDYGIFGGRSFRRDSGWDVHLGGGVRYTSQTLTAYYERTIYLPKGTGRTFDAKDYYIAMTLGGGLSNEQFDLGAGVSVKPLNMQAGESDVWAWAYDIGLLGRMRVINTPGVRLIPSAGVSLLNLGGNVDYYDRQASLPDMLRAGISLQLELLASDQIHASLQPDARLFVLSASFEYRDIRYNNVDRSGQSFGVEGVLWDVLSLRTGYNRYMFSANGVTYGAGLGWEISEGRLQLDYGRFPMYWLLGGKDQETYTVSVRMNL